ncbi:MAG: class II D-tagatose-bisphosphate aldolase, non-catalytic subunit [Opitutaceae bacterium]|nr:class II D-tagatose-bisphosphate aldolase, non-catalytic subunit [Opitutaceae bacterium]
MKNLTQTHGSADQPVVDRLLAEVRRLHATGRPWATLLAVCPNSEAVLRAATLAAAQSRAPMLLAATLNQVDLDRGYTGWTPEDLVRLCRAFSQAYGYSSRMLACVDHGGPWLKDKHTLEHWSLEASMDGVKQSLLAALEAGYDLLHVDPTVDRTLPHGENIRIETVVERTLTLIRQVETHRRSHNLPRIAYEVGTEEVHGGLADLTTFRFFLRGLRLGLSQAGLGDIWPCFVVGKVGTDLHTTSFDADVALTLHREVQGYGSVIKGHYSDNVENPTAYPASFMGGANVGPEFTEIEHDALMELEARERKTLGSHASTQSSGIGRALEAAVVDSGRWRKWLQPGETGRDFHALSPERRAWLVRTGCRYIWTQAGVREARSRLHANLQAQGVDSEAFVVGRIADRIAKYCRAFNLEGLLDEISFTL